MIDDLTDAQVKTLLKADIYRETGGKDKEEVEQMKQGTGNPSSGYSRGPSSASVPSGGSVPSTGRF